MRAVIQRVTGCTVTVQNRIIGKIDQGMLVLLGVAQTDTERESQYLADKLIHLRIFEDINGRMNLSLLDIAGQMLVVSQFTLLGDCRKGRRPSFSKAAEPKHAETLYHTFCRQVQNSGTRVETGQFGAHMNVSLVNDGPVTLIVDSPPAS